jgi:hypothetical protein
MKGKTTEQELRTIETAMRERSAVEAPPPGAERPQVPTEDAWAEIERNWHEVIPSIREAFSALGEEELAATGGDYERLLGFLGERYQLTRREAETRLETWRAQFGARASEG